MKQYAGTVCAISPSLQGIIVWKCDFMPDSLTFGVPQLKLYKVNSKLSSNILVFLWLTHQPNNHMLNMLVHNKVTFSYTSSFDITMQTSERTELLLEEEEAGRCIK